MEEVCFRRLVVGVDGSPASQRALVWAAHEAVSWGVGLDVVHAWRLPCAIYANGDAIDPSRYEKEAYATLDAVAASAELGSLRPDIRFRPVRDDAAAALLGAARGAELLVLGARGHGGFAGLLLGSVSERCVVHAPCSVAVIPPTWARNGTGRIVVGVDGSGPSYAALEWAIAAAARRGGHLDVINAYHSHGLAPTEEASRSLVNEMVGKAIGRSGHHRIVVELIATPADPAHALIDAARDADLLVVAAHGGPNKLRGLLLGSVSRHCVHHAACPVVVARTSPLTRTG